MMGKARGKENYYKILYIHSVVNIYCQNCHIYTIICLKSVVVRKLQVAILARSPREMSQTDRIVWKHILSRVCVSVRPRICFICEKNPNLSLIESPACCLFQWITDRPLSRQRRKRCTQPYGLIGRTDTATVVGGVGVCVFASVHACMCACAMCLQYTITIFYPG